ncbi:MAG TPA: methyltransferase domain-containing protein [Actinomycetes bacterium]|jgi:SAM-dependent methyltransferase|nr:methyltransferase domain-containing protein [Actinomycetes bacterium]
MNATSALPTSITVQEQAPLLLSQIAGYIGHRTVAVGLRSGLVGALAEAPAGATVDSLAHRLGFDPFYVAVWCRSAFAAGVVDRDGDRYQLAPHIGTLLLDTTSPAYVGGVFTVLEQDEVFDRFEASLASGERLWWDRCSPVWIREVSQTGTPFYTRLIPGGLARVPGLADRLAAGCRIVDSACGTGVGLVRLARAYPGCTIVGVDGDGNSVDLARKRVADAGLAGRVTIVCSPLEELHLQDPAALVLNNISMHECRGIDQVTRNILAALEPGGWFVISDFPFPDTDQGLRTTPGRIMCGIQFFEAQIDDQLLPPAVYHDLLRRHGFSDLGSLTLTPLHAVTHARRPG